jgi:DNA-binding response OmpR family regulator
MRILCVGAGPRVEYLSTALMESNHSVVTLGSVVDAAYLVTVEQIDTVIVLAHGSAVDAANALVARPEHTDLVIIDSRGTHDARVAALYAGADACFTAQYEYAELEARLQAFWRDAGVIGASDVVNREGVTLSSFGAGLSRATRSLTDACGASLVLSRREYLLIERLLRGAGTVVSRDDLIAYVFGDAEADGISLQRLTTALRRRMLDAGCKLSVETVPRVGYRVVSGSLIPTGPAEDSPQGS